MSSMTVFRKVMKMIGAYLPLLVLSVLLAGVSVLMQMYVPILFGEAIDCIVGTGSVNVSSMADCFRKIIVLLLLSAAFTYLMSLINNRISYRVVEDIRKKAIRHIQILPV